MPSYRPREFERRLVAQSTMRTHAIVILSPRFCHGPRILKQQLIAAICQLLDVFR